MMRRPKIVIVASWYPTREYPIGGIFIREQAMELSRVADVAVIAPRAQAWRRLLVGKLLPQCAVEHDEGLLTWRPRWLSAPRQQGTLRYVFAARPIRRSFERLTAAWGRPDLVHAHSLLPAGIAVADAHRRWGIPAVLTEHMGPFSALLQSPGDRRAIARAISGFDRVLAVSDGLKTDIQQLCPDARVEVVPNLVRTRFFAPAPPGDQRPASLPVRFLAVGLLSPEKGHRHLLEAVGLLMARGRRDFEVILGGDGPLRTALERQAADLGLGPHVRFVGMLPREKVRRQMQDCDVFVCPSLHESFGIAMAEALACGKPVLASRTQGGRTVVTPDCGRLVPPGDPQALADAMEQLVADRGTFAPVHLRQSIVERFGEDRFLANIQAIYAPLLETAPTSAKPGAAFAVGRGAT